MLTGESLGGFFRFSRNPLGIIALFIVLIYGVAGYVKTLFENGCGSACGVIQAWDVDPSESWPDGRYAKKTKRYPLRSDG